MNKPKSRKRRSSFPLGNIRIMIQNQKRRRLVKNKIAGCGQLTKAELVEISKDKCAEYFAKGGKIHRLDTV